MYSCVGNTNIYIFTNVYTYTFFFTHTQTRTRTHTHTHTHIHTHIAAYQSPARFCKIGKKSRDLWLYLHTPRSS